MTERMTKREIVDLFVGLMQSRDPETRRALEERLMSSCTKENGWIIHNERRRTNPWWMFWKR